MNASDERIATISAEQLQGYENYPAAVKDLVDRSLALTRMKLRYAYGSADPSKGGMDCSGTINHLLQSAGVKNVPRQANTIYGWVWKKSRFHAVVSPNLNSFEFQYLQPGDLLFWSGTYAVDRDPPVTHVMMYLGKLKPDGKQVMFGASSGRYYAGKARDGVSVFDFVLPKTGGEGRFLGYASVPELDKLIIAPPPKADPETIPVPAITDPQPLENLKGVETSPITSPELLPEGKPEEVPPQRALPVEPEPESVKKTEPPARPVRSPR